MSAPVEAPPADLAATPWLREGQRLEGSGRLDAALACYDQALAAAGQDAHASSVAWMNRGSALQRYGDPGRTAAALAAYDAAIARQRRLPLAGDAGRRISLAAALMNRALLLHRLHGVGRAADAFAAGAEAGALLQPLLIADTPFVVRRNFGGICVNRANLLLDLGDHAAADAAAHEALALVAPVERIDPDCASVGLMARRALCDALGRQLVAPGADQESIAAAASDTVDDALALARHWSEAGGAAFGPLVARLYRFGARLYRTHQPQFLGEFLLEQLEAAPSPELQAIAAAALEDALDDLQRPRPLVAGAPATEKLLATVRALRTAQARVAALAAPAAPFPACPVAPSFSGFTLPPGRSAPRFQPSP